MFSGRDETSSIAQSKGTPRDHPGYHGYHSCHGYQASRDDDVTRKRGVDALLIDSPILMKRRKHLEHDRHRGGEGGEGKR